MVVPYLITGIFIFGMNVVPAFMPPTWIVLAFFYYKYRLSFFAAIVIGAIAATCGRVVLAFISNYFLRPFLSKNTQKNFKTLGTFFNKNIHVTIPLIIIYAFLPIPSNQVFVAAGLSEIDYRILAFSFLFGRLISYSFWIAATHMVVRKLELIFIRQYSNFHVLITELIGFSVLILISRIPWKKLLQRYMKRIQTGP